MISTIPVTRFGLLDWFVVAGYLALVIVIGTLAARRRGTSDGYFLAGRSMPVWAVAISVLATSQSAATFVGGPQEAYAGDLTYLTTNLGTLIAAVVVAFVFLPRFYRHNVTSVYEIIGHEMGSRAQQVASAMFMLGRVFASGARLYIVALPFSLVAFGNLAPTSLAISILIVATVATAYSIAGGIRAVIWTDVVQVILYVSCVSIALTLLWQKIPLGVGELIDVLRTHDAESKLTLIDLGLDSTKPLGFDFSRPYTLWATLIGITLLMIAAYGADQDLTQRMLTCRSPRRATASLLLATLITWPVILIFLVMGLLLYVFYNLPEVTGAAQAPELTDTRRVFLSFILREMPVGMRGLMMAGLLAAAMSSMDSALNAMSSTTIADFYRPWRARAGGEVVAEDDAERRMARFASLGWAIALAGFACLCIWWQTASGDTLIAFALGVMTFAYSGLLGVFFAALFTRRGNTLSAIAAMATGFATVLALEPWIIAHWATWLDLEPFTVAFPWKLAAGTMLSTGVCLLGARPSRCSGSNE